MVKRAPSRATAINRRALAIPTKKTSPRKTPLGSPRAATRNRPIRAIPGRACRPTTTTARPRPKVVVKTKRRCRPTANKSRRTTTTIPRPPAPTTTASNRTPRAAKTATWTVAARPAAAKRRKSEGVGVLRPKHGAQQGSGQAPEKGKGPTGEKGGDQAEGDDPTTPGKSSGKQAPAATSGQAIANRGANAAWRRTARQARRQRT